MSEINENVGTVNPEETVKVNAEPEKKPGFFEKVGIAIDSGVKKGKEVINKIPNGAKFALGALGVVGAVKLLSMAVSSDEEPAVMDVPAIEPVIEEKPVFPGPETMEAGPYLIDKIEGSGYSPECIRDTYLEGYTFPTATQISNAIGMPVANTDYGVIPVMPEVQVIEPVSEEPVVEPVIEVAEEAPVVESIAE